MTKKMFEKNARHFIVASISWAAVGAVLIGLVLEFDIPDNGAWPTWFYLLCTLVSIFLGLIATIKIFKNIIRKPISGIIGLLVLFLAAISLLGIMSTLMLRYSERGRLIRYELATCRYVGSGIYRYADINNGYLPDANSWCQSLIDIGQTSSWDEYSYTQYSFNTYSQKVKSSFAFNKNVSRLPLKEIAGNVVLIFEADGDLNLSGGEELVNIKRDKDNFIIGPMRFMYVMFIDGTAAKYRLRDGAVALYDPNTNNEFGRYKKKGVTPYSPLKWK